MNLKKSLTKTKTYKKIRIEIGLKIVKKSNITDRIYYFILTVLNGILITNVKIFVKRMQSLKLVIKNSQKLFYRCRINFTKKWI